MHIIVIAYACEPNKSSEPGVGWNFTQEIAKFANVTVITRSNNRKAIESTSSHKHINFIYVDLGKWLRNLKKTAPFGTQGYYVIWQWLAYLKARALSKKAQFEILHHLTFGISWISPPVYLTDLPFVWGPIGGGDTIPHNITKTLTRYDKLREYIYKLVSYVTVLSPFSAYTRYRAKHIFIRSRSCIKALPNFPPFKASVMCETATSQEIDPKTNHAIDENEVIFLSIGRMTYWKGYSNAILAFGKYIKKGGKGKFILLGEGPELNKLKEYIAKNNLNKNIILKGSVPHKQVVADLIRSDVLVHPSFRDGGSWAIMEGMTYGLPVICLETSGPADMVDRFSGILIKPKNNKQIIQDLSKAMQTLATNHHLRKKLSKNAQHRIDNFYRWKQKGLILKEIYNEVLASS